MANSTNGSDEGGNVTRATFLGFIDEYLDADQAVADAVGRRKDLRKRIKGAGLNLASFDRSRKEADKSGDKREAEDREYRRYMAWLGKPLGFQAAMDLQGDQATDEDDGDAVSDHQVRRVEDAGFVAGKSGQHRGSNPWTPGTFLYQRWDEKWMAGQEAIAQTLAPSDAAAPKRAGRPKGSRNKPRTTSAIQNAESQL